MDALERRFPFDGDGTALHAALRELPGAILLDDSTRPRRLTMVGVAPRATLEWRPGGGVLRERSGATSEIADLFGAMRELIAARRGERGPRDVPFWGGLAGYVGFDVRREIERVPDANPADSSLPDVLLADHDTVAVLDEGDGAGGVRVIASGDPRDREERIEHIGALLAAGAAAVPPYEAARPTPAVPTIERAEYLRRVDRIRGLIEEGEVYQVNFTQRLLVRCEADPLAVFERLRRDHPAPYAAVMSAGGATVVSLSPERFLRVDGDRVESSPIKGTIARGGDPAEDAAAAERLLASEKDRAELAMIVDLVRNDLSRVCRPGSVVVRDHAHIESAPTVHHLVTDVLGELRPECDVVDLLRATSPGGSITGAPKIRALEIIDRLESVRRGVYTGSIGYVAPDGRADFNIAIRTMVIEAGYARIHGGGGVVHDSDPATEWAESVVKVRGLLDALGGEIDS